MPRNALPPKKQVTPPKTPRNAEKTGMGTHYWWARAIPSMIDGNEKNPSIWWKLIDGIEKKPSIDWWPPIKLMEIDWWKWKKAIKLMGPSLMEISWKFPSLMVLLEPAKPSIFPFGRVGKGSRTKKTSGGEVMVPGSKLDNKHLFELLSTISIHFWH